MNNGNSSSLLPTLLLVVFVTMKLVGKIDWSWWWVLSPLWIPLLVAVPIAVFGLRWVSRR